MCSLHEAFSHSLQGPIYLSLSTLDCKSFESKGSVLIPQHTQHLALYLEHAWLYEWTNGAIVPGSTNLNQDSGTGNEKDTTLMKEPERT